MDNCQFLSAIDPFRQLPPEDLITISESFRKRFYPPGAAIVEQGRPVPCVGVILSGSAKVVVVDHTGGEIVCGHLHACDLVFDVAVLSETVAGAGIVSREETVCLLQMREDFIAGMDRCAPLKHFFYHNTALGIRWGYEIFSGRHMPAFSNDFGDSLRPPFIRKALAYIDKNYSQPITLETVARKTGMSKFYFSRLFKQEMGMSFKRYLNLTRIQAAKTLLARDEYNVTEVGYAVGFNDASYFSRVFRKVEGSSPKKFLSPE